MFKILHLPSSQYIMNPCHRMIWPFHNEGIARDTLRLILERVNSDNPTFIFEHISKGCIEYGGWNILPMNSFLRPKMSMDEFDIREFIPPDKPLTTSSGSMG